MIKVLIADDQELIRQSLQIVLGTEKDIEVLDAVENGVEVVRLVRREKPDVILMDIRMPEMDGVVCTQIIKENYLNDSSSEAVNSKLELLSNVYGGRILLVDRDFKIVKDTYHVDEGRTLVSSKVIRCFKNGGSNEYRSDDRTGGPGQECGCVAGSGSDGDKHLQQ